MIELTTIIRLTVIGLHSACKDQTSSATEFDFESPTYIILVDWHR